MQKSPIVKSAGRLMRIKRIELVFADKLRFDAKDEAISVLSSMIVFSHAQNVPAQEAPSLCLDLEG